MTPRPPDIFFHPDAVESEGKDLVGRRSAGQSFLKGWLAHVPHDRLGFVTETPRGRAPLEAALQALGETRPFDLTHVRGSGPLSHGGCVVFPGPGFQGLTWKRLGRGDPRACSLVGLTHTVSTRRVIEGLHGLVSEPVEPWDAIICTSRAVQAVVARQFEEEAAFFKDRFGARRVPLPDLPVIPLGISAADFAPRPDARAALRARFGAPDDAVVLLTMGRWTSVEKANPAPLMLVLEELATRLDRPLHLWMAGWASREAEAELHRRAAATLAPSVTTRMIDGRDPEIRAGIWSGADIFTLPVDNIQETFGLVPVEAMAAGLPVVIPDWDGFRDTVVHGETGYLVPTRMAPPGAGAVLARRFAEGTDGYVQHLSLVAQQTVIDLGAYGAALEALARDPDLRARMGAAGRAHVAARFDWAAVVPLYLDLAKDLAARRASRPPVSEPRHPVAPHPLQIDPFAHYARYPSDVVDRTTPLSPTGASLDADRLAALDAVNGRELYDRRVAPPDLTLKAAEILDRDGPMTVGELAGRLGLREGPTIAIALFLAKFGVIALPKTHLHRDTSR